MKEFNICKGLIARLPFFFILILITSCDKLFDEITVENNCIQWHKNFGGGGNDYVSKIFYTTIGHLVLDSYVSSKSTNYTGTSFIGNDFIGQIFIRTDTNGVKEQASLNFPVMIDGELNEQNNIVGIFNNGGDFDPSSSISNISGNGLILARYGVTFSLKSAKLLVGNAGINVIKPRKIKITKDNKIIIAGQYGGELNFNSNGTPVIRKSNGKLDVFILKTDIDGNFIEVETFGGLGNDYVSDMIINDNSEVIVIGSFEQSILFSNSINIISKGKTDMFMGKLSLDGLTFKWAKSIGSENGDIINSVIELDDRNLLIGGGITGQVNFGNSGSQLLLKSNYNTNYTKFLVKVSNVFEPEWGEVYENGIVSTLEKDDKNQIYLGATNSFTILDSRGKIIDQYSGLNVSDIHYEKNIGVFVGGRFEFEPKFSGCGVGNNFIFSNEAGFGYSDAFFFKYKN